MPRKKQEVVETPDEIVEVVEPVKKQKSVFIKIPFSKRENAEYARYKLKAIGYDPEIVEE